MHRNSLIATQLLKEAVGVFNHGDTLMYMNEARSPYYRVSVKGLVLNEVRDKFLLCEKKTGVWELPGGGLDWGMTPQEDLPREIAEEMGLTVIKVADNPCYFMTSPNLKMEIWVVNVVYETELEHLNFTASDECVNIKFVNKNDIGSMNVFPTIQKLAEMFKPENHSR
jgi:ADP-ribose pyrophosphatase YjhB (NUDIX family)